MQIVMLFKLNYWQKLRTEKLMGDLTTLNFFGKNSHIVELVYSDKRMIEGLEKI